MGEEGHPRIIKFMSCPNLIYWKIKLIICIMTSGVLLAVDSRVERTFEKIITYEREGVDRQGPLTTDVWGWGGNLTK